MLIYGCFGEQATTVDLSIDYLLHTWVIQLA